MAYTKTQWADNTTPIDKDNLNKIEQGIYDNSLVVDAVTNTINPTDTETYKTAELTEGQITDVIGVNDIVIEGDTSQDGTPTPSAPVDVNVVSGSNVVNTSNKNLFIPLLKIENISGYTKACIISLIKDEYVFTATGSSDMYFNRVRAAGESYSNDCGQKIYVNNNTKISFYITNTNFNNTYITAYNSEGVSLGFTGIASNRGTYTVPENCDFITFRMGKGYPTVGTVYKTKVMVVYGDTIPTTYEPHQGKELHLDLGSIELCKIGNYQDYFYKSGSKWYLHKEIGKITFNGTESWSVANTGTSNFYYQVAGLTTPKSQDIMPISDYFIGVAITNSNTDVGAWIISSGTIRLRTITEDTLANFKTWLSTNTPLLYYVLATVTDTEITDTTLISQLEAIYNAPLYEQTNITQINNDLPMVLDITACKDNINGIKAFIRK